jgi:glutaredoxin
MKRVSSLVALVVLVSCHQSSEKPAAQAAVADKPEGPAPAKISVTKERTDLVFTYVDPTGQFHDVMKIDEVPEESRAQVLVRDLSKSPDELHAADYLYEADLRQPDANGRYTCGAVSRFSFEKHGAKSAADGAAQKAAERGDALVTVYSASWCGVCKTAKAWLKKRGIPYIEKDVERDAGAAEELSAKAAQQGLRPSGVPVIDVAGELMMGFDAEALSRLLEKKGLSKTL